MTARAVISACLIALERVERLELIPKLFERVHAPPAVVDEIARAPEWLLVQGVGNQSLLKALRTQLDEGESEVIALAAELENRSRGALAYAADTVANEVPLSLENSG